jgi:hypothetical protein
MNDEWLQKDGLIAASSERYLSIKRFQKVLLENSRSGVPSPEVSG